MGATGYLNHPLGSSVEVGWKKERQEDLALCLGSFPPFLRPFALSAKEDQTPRNQGIGKIDTKRPIFEFHPSLVPLTHARFS